MLQLDDPMAYRNFEIQLSRAGADPDSIPPLDRHWLLVAWSADFADVGPTLACQPTLWLDVSIFCRRWLANGGFSFKMAASNNRGFGVT